MQLLNINDFIKNAMEKCRDYIYMSDVEFSPNSHCYWAFIAYRLYNDSESMNVVKPFFLFIAMSNPMSFIFQYIAKSIIF